MNNIPESLQPTIDTFIKGLDEIEHKYIERQKDIEVELEITKQCQFSLKQQTIQNNKNHEARAEKLNREIDRTKELQTQLQSEIEKTRLINKGVDELKRKTEDAFKNAEAERQLAEATRRKADASVKHYNDKTALLQGDSAAIALRLAKVIDREVACKAKELANLKQTEKLLGESSDLSIREIELKKKLQQVDLEIKRAKVNV